MALTKITRAILDTGVSDSSDATAITIDSSENVGIGVTTPFSQTQITETGWSSGAPYGTVLTVTGNNTNDANWGHLLITDSSTGTGNGGMLRFAVGSTSSDISPHSGIDGFTEGSNYGGLKFLTRPNGGTSTERMRITSSGNIGIGTTSPSAELHINDTGGLSRIRLTGTAANADDFEFGQGTTGVANGGFEIYDVNESTTRFLIDSNGKILIGKTASSITANAGFELTDGGLNMYSTQTSGSVSSTYHVLYGSSTKFYVDYAGVVYASNTSITSLSDERLKENVKDLDTGLSDILELKPKRFDWKEGEGTGEKNVSGFIAQDVEDTNFSDLVGNFKHNSLDDCKSFQYSGLIPALVKSIQELSAKVEELESKINE